MKRKLTSAILLATLSMTSQADIMLDDDFGSLILGPGTPSDSSGFIDPADELNEDFLFLDPFDEFGPPPLPDDPFTIGGTPLESVDWVTAGDELITLDPSSNLNYLDLSFTLNESFSSVVERLSTDLEGWRVANVQEIQMLFNSVFSEPPAYRNDGSAAISVGTEQYNEAHHFTSLLGSFSLDDNGYAYGLYQDEAETLRMAGVYMNSDSGSVFGTDYFKSYDYTLDVPHPHFATFLVRDGELDLPEPPPSFALTSVETSANAVPEPGSLGLMSAALFGLALVSRRRTKNK